MIVSTVNGRIRVRSPRLKSRPFAAEVRPAAAAMTGVDSVRVNRAAGSLVATFDPDSANPLALERALERLCLSPGTALQGAAGSAPVVARRRAGGNLSRQLNRATKVGMITTLGTSLAYGFAGRKKPHIRFGAAFLVLAGAHMFRYQRTLLR